MSFKKCVLTVLTATAVTVVGLPDKAAAVAGYCVDVWSSNSRQRVSVCVSMEWREYVGGVYNKYRIRGSLSRYSSAPDAVITARWVKLEQSTLTGWEYQGGTNPNYPKTNTLNENTIVHVTPDFTRAFECQIQRGYLLYRVRFNTGQTVDGNIVTYSFSSCY